MRAIALALLLASAPAAADSFVGASGGVMVPLGDSHQDDMGWSDQVSSSPKVGVRVGGVGRAGLGGMLTADWTPISYNFNSQLLDVSAHRFRILVHALFEKPVAPKLTLAFRAGAGIDIAHATADLIAGPDLADTDVGWAVEVGGGVWWRVGSLDVGGEVALPFGGHSHDAKPLSTEITFDYTSYDLDFLFVLRLRSK
jgi:hypothetical protein